MKLVEQPTRFNDLIRGEHNASNAGIVTVLNTVTTIASSVSWTVFAYQWILAQVSARMTKGGVTGNSVFVVEKTAGTATVQWIGNKMPQVIVPDHPNAVTCEIVITALFKVTVAGTLTLSLRGTSFNSNGTVAAGDGKLRTIILDRL